MGRAIIKQDHGNGLYYVEVQVDQSLTTTALQRLNAKIIYVEGQQVILESELDDLEFDYNTIYYNNIIIIDVYVASNENLKDDIAVYTSELTILNSELAALKILYPRENDEDDWDPLVVSKQNEVDAKKKQIAAKEDQIKNNKTSIAKYQAEIDAAKLAVTQKENQITYTKAEILSLQKRYELMSRLGVVENFDTYAWCCDITEGLVGYVPIIEVGTEIKDERSYLNIFPGYPDGASVPGYTVASHGELMPFFSLPLADSLRNFIAMPAIQKWAPTFRYGILGAIDYGANTCTVNLNFTSSSIQSLSINKQDTLTNVPIQYMGCDAGAFEEGDEVVVKFINHNWDTPRVIGFKDHPKPCGWQEPWDGPLYNSLWSWVYFGEILTYNFDYTRYYEHEIGRITTSGGIGSFISDAIPVEEQTAIYLEVNNFWQYIPGSGNYIMEKVSKMTFDADWSGTCFDSGYGYEFYFAVRAFVEGDSEPYTFVLYIVRSFYNQYGCDGFDKSDTGWIQYGSSRGYHRHIPFNTEGGLLLPTAAPLVNVDAVEVGTSRYLGGAWSGSEKVNLNQSIFTCNRLALD